MALHAARDPGDPTAWNDILAGARAVWNLVKAALINPITEAWHTITSTVSKIGSAIGSGLSKAWTAVKDIGSKFLSIGASIVEGIINGVENAASSLFSSLKNLASGALNAAKSALGINSPSKVFASVVGVSIPEGIAKGVDDHAMVAHNAVKKMTAALPTSASASFTGSTKLAAPLPTLAALPAGGGRGNVGQAPIVFDFRGSRSCPTATWTCWCRRSAGESPRTRSRPGCE
ncbi:hypothetical protein ACFQZC_20045 [Streptacidiphilus monticola]